MRYLGLVAGRSVACKAPLVSVQAAVAAAFVAIMRVLALPTCRGEFTLLLFASASDTRRWSGVVDAWKRISMCEIQSDMHGGATHSQDRI